MSEDSPEYDVDFREHPEKYEIGRGEEGILQPPFFTGASLARSLRSRARSTPAEKAGSKKPRSLRSRGDDT